MTMYTPEPIQPHLRPPASSTPLHDYLNIPHPGVPEGYVVMPRSLVEAMPLPWQQAMVQILAEFHQAYGHLDWIGPEARDALFRTQLELIATAAGLPTA